MEGWLKTEQKREKKNLAICAQIVSQLKWWHNLLPKTMYPFKKMQIDLTKADAS